MKGEKNRTINFFLVVVFPTTPSVGRAGTNTTRVYMHRVVAKGVHARLLFPTHADVRASYLNDVHARGVIHFASVFVLYGFPIKRFRHVQRGARDDATCTYIM